MISFDYSLDENNFQFQLFHLVNFFFSFDKFVLLISSIFEITQNYIVILFKVVRRKHILKTSQVFTCYHKINQSNAKVPHITELFACTRKILAIMFLFSIYKSLQEHAQHKNYRNKQFHFC